MNRPGWPTLASAAGLKADTHGNHLPSRRNPGFHGDRYVHRERAGIKLRVEIETRVMPALGCRTGWSTRLAGHRIVIDADPQSGGTAGPLSERIHVPALLN